MGPHFTQGKWSNPLPALTVFLTENKTNKAVLVTHLNSYLPPLVVESNDIDSDCELQECSFIDVSSPVPLHFPLSSLGFAPSGSHYCVAWVGVIGCEAGIGTGMGK